MRTGSRALGSGLSIAVVVLAWHSCRTPEATLSTCFLAGVALAAAVLLIAWTVSTHWAGAARWLALALCGQAAALQLIDAGVLIHYQHYRLPADAAADPVQRWALVSIALQTVLTGAGLAARRQAIGVWLSNRRNGLCLVAGVAFAGSVAAALSRDPRFFVFEVSLSAFLQAVNAANVLLFAWSLPTGGVPTLGRMFDALLGPHGEAGRSRIDRFAVLAALSVTLVSAFLSYTVYQRHPHVADEVVYVYNARYFAAGQVAMPPPPLVPAFEVDLMEYQPHQWYGVVPPGWPAVLAVGAAVGAAWLVNPVLAGLNILLTYLLLGELYPRRVVRIAILLLCFSPWHIFLSMSYMNHTLTMMGALLAFLGVAKARSTGLARWAWMAGAGVGAGSLIRPLDGLIIGALAGAWAIGIGGKRLKFWSLAAVAAGTVIVAALTLPYNKALTGDAMASPLMHYLDVRYGPKSNAYGFGPERGLGWATDAYPGHTPFEAVINAELNGSCLNTELLGWSTGSLVLIAILLLSGGMRRADYLMLAAAAAVVLAYAPYWGTGGPDFGARYWYTMLVPCIALSARGLAWLEIQRGARATAAVAVLCGLALINYVPWRSIDKYRNYLRMRPDVRILAEDYHFGRSLVLVRGEGFPDYASAAIYNPLDLQADAPVYAWDRDPKVQDQVLKLYADRPVWIVEGPSRTQAGFRIAAGPLKASDIAVGEVH